MFCVCVCVCVCVYIYIYTHTHTHTHTHKQTSKFKWEEALPKIRRLRESSCNNLWKQVRKCTHGVNNLVAFLPFYLIILNIATYENNGTEYKRCFIFPYNFCPEYFLNEYLSTDAGDGRAHAHTYIHTHDGLRERCPLFLYDFRKS